MEKIADHRVAHIWKKAEDDDCDQDAPDQVKVQPDFYQENGTPICWCGQDMIYSHTEILVEE